MARKNSVYILYLLIKIPQIRNIIPVMIVSIFLTSLFFLFFIGLFIVSAGAKGKNDIIDTIESIINMFLFIVKFKKINGININKIKDVMRHSLLFPAWTPKPKYLIILKRINRETTCLNIFNIIAKATTITNFVIVK